MDSYVVKDNDEVGFAVREYQLAKMWSELLSLCVANVCELIKIAKQEVKHVLVKNVAKVMWRESKSNKVPAALLDHG